MSMILHFVHRLYNAFLLPRAVWRKLSAYFLPTAPDVMTRRLPDRPCMGEARRVVPVGEPTLHVSRTANARARNKKTGKVTEKRYI